MTKPLPLRDAIRFLMLLDPTLSSTQIQQRLVLLGFECTTFVVSSLRSSFRDDLRFLKRLGLLNNKRPKIPLVIRRLRKPKQEPVPAERYFRWGDD